MIVEEIVFDERQDCEQVTQEACFEIQEPTLESKEVYSTRN